MPLRELLCPRARHGTGRGNDLLLTRQFPQTIEVLPLTIRRAILPPSPQIRSQGQALGSELGKGQARRGREGDRNQAVDLNASRRQESRCHRPTLLIHQAHLKGRLAEAPFDQCRHDQLEFCLADLLSRSPFVAGAL
jgi:hypothetical protein